MSAKSRPFSRSRPALKPTVSFARRITESLIGPLIALTYEAQKLYVAGLKPCRTPELLTMFARPLISRFCELFGTAIVESIDARTGKCVPAVRVATRAGVIVMF